MQQTDQFDTRVSFRCMTTQKHGLVHNAHHKGVTLGAYLRQYLFDAAIPKQSRRLPPASLRKELALITSELNKSASNINQVARQLNTWARQGTVSEALVASILPILEQDLLEHRAVCEYLFQLLLRSDI